MDKETKQSQETKGKDGDVQAMDAKDVIARSAERWLARNRSLVLRQTPVWAQSLALIMISLGVSGITALLLELTRLLQ